MVWCDSITGRERVEGTDKRAVLSVAGVPTGGLASIGDWAGAAPPSEPVPPDGPSTPSTGASPSVAFWNVALTGPSRRLTKDLRGFGPSGPDRPRRRRTGP